MWNYFSFLVIAAACFYQAWTVHSGCVNLSDVSGNIIKFLSENEAEFNCWNILNPNNLSMVLELKELDFDYRENSPTLAYLRIKVEKTGKTFQFTSRNDEGKLVVVHSNVTVILYLFQEFRIPTGRKIFELDYSIDDSVEGVEGAKEARSQAVDSLRSKWSSWKWMDHIPKAVTALSLSEGPRFGDTDLRDNLMLKQRELQMSVSLLNNANLNEQLSTFINCLLSTCHNPRSFYGHDLVKLLKGQVESGNFTHPSSYLALCNANETWPERAYRDLANTYNKTINIPFRREYEAFAVMAVSCEIRRRGEDSMSRAEQLMNLYKNNIREFKALQKSSGNFGNMHRTALITQALIASGHKQDGDWNFYKAIRVLVESINAPPTDIISTYLILPLLNDKSLTDIASTNCSSLIDHEDLVAEMHDRHLGPKIKVRYSLLVGEAKDVIYTIVLKVPRHTTAFDVMKLIATKYSKYEFKYELEHDKVDVYEMVDIPNDPEGRKFWLFYLQNANGKDFSHVELGPSRPALDEEDHIAMWYKTADSL